MPKTFPENHGLARFSLHEAAVDRLREMIVSGDLSPGDRIGEESLATYLQVSRTPLREALKLLAIEGLVELKPNRGAWVARLDPDEMRETFEATAGIERIAAEHAASRCSSEILAEIEALQIRMEDAYEAGQLNHYSALNEQIHRKIVGASHNAVLVNMHRGLIGRIERARRLALRGRGRWRESITEHREILDALKSNSPAEAGQLLEHHVRRTGGIVVELLGEVTQH